MPVDDIKYVLSKVKQGIPLDAADQKIYSGLKKKERERRDKLKLEKRVLIKRLLKHIINDGCTTKEAAEKIGIDPDAVYRLKSRYQTLWDEERIDIAERLRDEQITAILKNRRQLNKASTDAITTAVDIMNQQDLDEKTRLSAARWLYEVAEAKNGANDDQLRTAVRELTKEEKGAIHTALGMFRRPVLEAEVVE